MLGVLGIFCLRWKETKNKENVLTLHHRVGKRCCQSDVPLGFVTEADTSTGFKINFKLNGLEKEERDCREWSSDRLIRAAMLKIPEELSFIQAKDLTHYFFKVSEIYCSKQKLCKTIDSSPSEPFTCQCKWLNAVHLFQVNPRRQDSS